MCYNIHMTKKNAVLVVCSNRKAYHDYFIEEDYEAGLCLLGAEVKSVRQKEALKSYRARFCRFPKDITAPLLQFLLNVLKISEKEAPHIM